MATEVLDAREARARVARRLRAIARLHARREALEAELEAELSALRARSEPRLEGLARREERLRAELEEFCRAERDAVLPPDRKSLRTACGEVGFRRTEPSVRVRDGLAEQEVCRRLRGAGLGELVRTREAPDRRAVGAALRGGRAEAERIRRCGLELAGGGERFHCRIFGADGGRPAARGRA